MPPLLECSDLCICTGKCVLGNVPDQLLGAFGQESTRCSCMLHIIRSRFMEDVTCHCVAEHLFELALVYSSCSCEVGIRYVFIEWNGLRNLEMVDILACVRIM